MLFLACTVYLIKLCFDYGKHFKKAKGSVLVLKIYGYIINPDRVSGLHV